MRRTRSLLLSVVLTAIAASAAGQDGNYRAPRTESGHPDLEGVWNVNTGVPLQRPVPFADKKVFMKSEFEQRRTGLRNMLLLASKLVPVEAVGLDWIDNTLHVEDLRTSLMTYPDNEKVVTERFTRIAANTIAYAATVVDPKTFQDRIELSFPMAHVNQAIYGFACHEVNYSLPLALSGARAEDEAKTTDSR